MTKMFALGALGLLGIAGAVGLRALRRRRAMKAAIDFDDLEEPVVVAEEVVIVTEDGPYGVEMELIPLEDLAAR